MHVANRTGGRDGARGDGAEDDEEETEDETEGRRFEVREAADNFDGGGGPTGVDSSEMGGGMDDMGCMDDMGAEGGEDFGTAPDVTPTPDTEE